MLDGLIYIEDFLTEAEEKFIVEDLDRHKWSNELRRRVQHYGYKYDYTKKSISHSMKVDDLLLWMIDIGKRIEKQFVILPPDQVIVNEYIPGQGISRHIDCIPCFKDTIISISLLSPCIMEFQKLDSIKHLTLKPRSVLVLQGESRYRWTHSIPTHFNKQQNIQSRRISITYRNVILNTPP